MEVPLSNLTLPPSPPDEILETYRARRAEAVRHSIGGELRVEDFSAILRFTARQCHARVPDVAALVNRARAEGLL